MALAIDASTPAVATQTNGATATVTTASFTPPSGALLLIRWVGNSQSGVNPSAPSITDNLGGHLSYTLVDWQSRADSPTVNGQAATWWALVGSSSAMTVTVTSGAASSFRHAAIHVTVITGQDSSPIGAHGKTGSGSASSIAQNYTAQATSGQGFIVVADWDDNGAQTAGTGCTLTNGGSASIAGQSAYGFVRRTSADDTNGGTNTLNVTIAATSANLQWTYAEVLPLAAATSIPYNPQRSVSLRDPGETYWLQKDRRNALLVATAANDLDEPLLQRTAQDEVYGLAAYRDRRLVPQQPNRVGDMSLFASAANDLVPPLLLQAGAHYWHLYDDVADRTWWPQQRTYYDPSLLTQVTAAVTYTAPRTVPPRDPGETWYLQAPRRDPSLLDTALLEPPLLGAADDVARHRTWYTDRRVQPQQREYFDLSLLLTALLESPLNVGSFRWILVDRRRQPQQLRWTDPSLLDIPADPLLLLDDRTRRYNTPATHRDRRQTVPERPRWTVFVSLDEAIGINVPFTSTNDGAVMTGATDGDRINSTTRGAVFVLTDGGPLFISQTKGGVL